MVCGTQPDPRYTRGRSTSRPRNNFNTSNSRGGNWTAPNQYQRQNGIAEPAGGEYDNTDWKGIAEHQ